MKWYLATGAFRNAVGILALAYLTSIGLSISLALFVVVFMGFLLYIGQVRYFVGKVAIVKIAAMFVGIYVFNRISLWILCERLGLPIYVGQFLTITITSGGSYLYLKRSVRD